MAALKEALETKIRQLNQNSESLKKIREWIDGYRGKVIQIITTEGAYHLIFTKDGAKMMVGEYPSVDLTLRGEAAVLLQILNRESSISKEIRSGSLTARQNLHEAYKLDDIITTLKTF